MEDIVASFLEEAQLESQWKARTPCGLGLALAKLTEEQQADVQEALDADDVRGEAIARILKRRFSIDISARTVNRHRQNACQCGRVVR